MPTLSIWDKAFKHGISAVVVVGAFFLLWQQSQLNAAVQTSLSDQQRSLTLAVQAMERSVSEQNKALVEFMKSVQASHETQMRVLQQLQSQLKKGTTQVPNTNDPTISRW